MAGPSRIDELRKKFDENPRRYFAPLANEYRKIGDFDQAIFICQEFLPQQPGHMSGHIVYGQALFEAGRHDEARGVFETALSLDPENLIALRHLGDIARAHGDNETARAWYRRVLESDPRNEEIAGILSSLDAEDGQAAAPPSASPESSPAAETTGFSPGSAASDFANTAAANPAADEPLTSAPSESTFDELAKLFTSPEQPSAANADNSLGLIHEGEDVLGQAGAPEEAASTAGAGGAATPQSLAPESTPFSAPFLEALGAAPEPPAAAESAPPPPQAVQPAAENPANASSAFVTETMAELYLRQGHHELALDVYRKLAALRPEDAALRARLEELERPAKAAAPPPPVQDAGPTIREFLASIAEFRPRVAPNGASPAAESPPAAPQATAARGASPNENAGAGASLHDMFVEPEDTNPTAARAAPSRAQMADLPLLEDKEPPASGIAGKPASRAESELSLDHVFRHATPAAGTAAQPPSFSFDQFFSQQAHKDVSATDAESATEGAGGGAGGGGGGGGAGGAGSGQTDDIQQFNAWLEGLKKT